MAAALEPQKGEMSCFSLLGHPGRSKQGGWWRSRRPERSPSLERLRVMTPACGQDSNLCLPHFSQVQNAPLSLAPLQRSPGRFCSPPTHSFTFYLSKGPPSPTPELCGSGGRDLPAFSAIIPLITPLTFSVPIHQNLPWKDQRGPCRFPSRITERQPQIPSQPIFTRQGNN